MTEQEYKRVLKNKMLPIKGRINTRFTTKAGDEFLPGELVIITDKYRGLSVRHTTKDSVAWNGKAVATRVDFLYIDIFFND